MGSEWIDRACVRSRWLWSSVALEMLAVALIASLLLIRTLPIWIWVAEQFCGDLDAPDNWAMGVTYCLRTAGVLVAFGAVMWTVGILRVSNAQRKKKQQARIGPGSSNASARLQSVVQEGAEQGG